MIATHLTYISILDSERWMIIAMLYMGVQGVLDYYRSNNEQPRLSEVPQQNA